VLTLTHMPRWGCSSAADRGCTGGGKTQLGSPLPRGSALPQVDLGTLVRVACGHLDRLWYFHSSLAAREYLYNTRSTSNASRSPSRKRLPSTATCVISLECRVS
jgi:hypothetical protein